LTKPITNKGAQAKKVNIGEVEALGYGEHKALAVEDVAITTIIAFATTTCKYNALTIIITSIKDDLIFYVPNARSISNS
jgi:hypothetical protein